MNQKPNDPKGYLGCIDPYLSLIIPCHNLEMYIGRCLQSIASQTLGKSLFEVVLVFDSCTDNTKNIAIETLKKHEVSFRTLDVDVSSPGLARNAGLEISRGKFIWFIDGEGFVHTFVLFDSEYGRYYDSSGSGLVMEPDDGMSGHVIRDTQGNGLFFLEGRLAKSVSETNGSTESYEYDEEGRPVLFSETVEDSSRDLLCMEYDQEGCLSLTYDPKTLSAIGMGYDRDILVNRGGHRLSRCGTGYMKDGSFVMKEYLALGLVNVMSTDFSTVNEVCLRDHNGVGTEFYYLGTRLMGEDRSDGKRLRYCYDNEGLCGFRYHDGTSWKSYTYVKNGMGDIVMVKDEMGVPKVKYAYDPFGNVTATCLNLSGRTDSKEEEEIARINPFRYRGYYYDEETRLYYLITRYYDPWIGKFISPDPFSHLDISSIGGVDLYCYCLNNPVMNIDPEGHFPVLAVILGITAAVGLGLTIGGVASDNNILTGVGLSLVAIPALISGALAMSVGITTLSGIVGFATFVSGIESALFATAEYQEGISGNNWMLDSGMPEPLYNTMLISFASLATLGIFASSFFIRLKSIQSRSLGNSKRIVKKDIMALDLKIPKEILVFLAFIRMHIMKTNQFQNGIGNFKNGIL